MEDIQGKVFSDFEVPTTSDGSYRGRKKISDETSKHIQMKFEQELIEVNDRLKSSKSKVKLLVTGGAIQLQATLPLKPNDSHIQGRNKKQYKISLGIPANFDGLKTAEEEAYELGKLIARKTFIWTDKYLGIRATKDKGITFKEFYEQFESRYFSTRKKTIRSEGSFNSYKICYKAHFYSDDIITAQNLKNKVLKINSVAVRRNVLIIARIIAKSLSLKIDFTDLTLKYKPNNRSIPDDNKIVTSINNFQFCYEGTIRVKPEYRNNWKIYKLAYGLMAIYGLRPREIFNQPDLEWFLSPDNKYNTFKVHSSNKTGYREAFPFIPEWIELFDLKNVEAIQLLSDKNKENINAEKLRLIVSNLSKNFKVCGIPFKPYDLRHACAIRAHLQGMPVKAAADNLGHTVEVHTKVYQQWFGLENRRKAFEQTFEGLNEVDKLKDEIASLRRKIAELEIENNNLKLANKV
ncbi:MAG: site-specific integrase [Rivularia sp. (in: Bacteria)]|nr:site-specific integrase [Rivularia sp. MS3]